MDRRAQRVGIWTGPLAGLLILLGAGLIARWIPPWVGPGAGPDEVARTFSEHADRIRFGTLVACVGFTLLAPWATVIAAQVRPRSPYLAQLLVVCAAVAAVFVVLTCCMWAAAVFRPGETDPAVTQGLNDLAWMTFLFSAPPFTLWTWTLAYAVLADDETPAYPRWVGFLSLWVGLLILPAGLVVFFKTGAFGWAGLMALYVPFAVFFVWLVTITRCTLANLR